MQQDRHLAAILFTDIVGYTAMMQGDENHAVAISHRYISVLKETVTSYNGKVLNDYGDGSLCTFPSATDAVHFAMEIQKKLRTDPAVPLRIGLHVGEIFFEDGKVFGDGVNVASRIQSLGVGNSILLSSALQNNIKNHLEIKTVSIGRFHFKNVEEPIEVFAIANEGLMVPKRNEMKGKLEEQKKYTLKKNIIIAVASGLFLLLAFIGYRQFSKNTGLGASLANSLIVLPFVTLDSSQAYFADGITTDLITELSNVKKIITLSWNTSEFYKHTSKSLKEIANETNVSYVLTGTIQKNNKNIRVNVALTNPENGQNLWANGWDADLQSVFDIQKQIAKEVAEELGIKLSMEEHARLDRNSTINFGAYDLFLKARAESRKFDSNYLHRSNQLLEEALKIEPDFPQALTLRANNLMDLTFPEGHDPIVDAAKARRDLDKSLSLDPAYSDTYLVLGTLNWYLEWDMKEAKKNLEKGWELSNYGEAPITQCFCGFIEFTMITGDFKGALALIDKVEKIDPYYPYAKEEKALIYGILHDKVSLRKMLDEPSGPVGHKAVTNYELGNYVQAINEFREKGDIYSFYSGLWVFAYYGAGMVKKSDSLVNQMIKRSDQERNIDFTLAFIFAARGDKEKALKWYKSAYRKHDLSIVYTRIFSELTLIIDEPEVRQILKQIGL